MGLAVRIGGVLVGLLFYLYAWRAVRILMGNPVSLPIGAVIALALVIFGAYVVVKIINFAVNYFDSRLGGK